MAVGDTKIGICNDVLVGMGIKPVLNLTSPNKRAAAINQLYDRARREVLAAWPWSFADARQQLSELVATPGYEFLTYWQLPLNYIKINGAFVDPEYSQPYKWRMENQNGIAVLAAEAPTGATLYCRYTADATDPVQFPADFINVLKLLLESRFAVPFRQSQDLAQAAYRKYEFKLAELKVDDVYAGDSGALMNRMDEQPRMPLIQARYD